MSGHLTKLRELGLALLALGSLLAALRLALLTLRSLRSGLRSLLAHLLTLRSRLRTHLAHLLALLSLAAGLRTLLAHLLSALALTLPLAHGVELGESLAGAVHRAGAVTLVVGAALAVGVAFVGTVDDHAAGAAVAVATGSTGPHPGIVGIEHHVHFTGAEGRAFGYDVVAQLVHLAFVLVGFAFRFDRTKKVGKILVLVAHIPALVGELLIGEVDAGKLLLKLFGIEFPSGFNSRSGKYHRVGRKAQGGGEKEGREESGRAGHGA